MAEDTTPPAEAQDNPAPDVEVAEIDSPSAGPNEPSDGASPPNTIRSRGLKVSNLRAAFEQGDSNVRPLRPLSVDSRNTTPNGRPSPFDADLARLKEVMAKEQEQRDADKKRLEGQDAEIARLKAQLEELESARAGRGAGDDDAPMEDVDTEKEELFDALHEARAMAESSEAESAALRTQLAEMKKSIATNTRIESHEMTDSAFQGELGTLCYQIQDWVVNRFRKTKIEASVEELVARIPTGTGSEADKRLAVLLQKWDLSLKMLLLQAVVTTSLMHIFEEPLPFGLPPKVAWSEAVRAALHGLKDVLDAPAYNRWRATTFDIICHSETMSPFVHSAANKTVSQVCATIDQITASTTTEVQTDALRNVVRRVIALSHSLRVQRAVYDVRLPSPDASFDVDTMEDVSHDYEGPEERSIRCAIFPLVSKPTITGQPNVIFKARVS